jgi:Trypsin-like peptidase domain
MDFDGLAIATGTGFLRRRGAELFLVTAWHNLSGREPDTLKPKHTHGAVPNYVTIEGYCFNQRLPLYYNDDPHDDRSCSRRFWQHPDGPEVDVAVLKIPAGPAKGWPVDESFFDPNQNEQLQLWVTQSCIVVGFPQGLVDRSQPNHVLPIYKGAQIASEPYIDFQGKPLVIIDATTRPGMSGSPVFVPAPSHGIQLAGNRFLGIYTGRLRDNPQCEDSALGMVFRPRVITKIFERITPFQEQSGKCFRPR